MPITGMGKDYTQQYRLRWPDLNRRPPRRPHTALRLYERGATSRLSYITTLRALPLTTLRRVAVTQALRSNYLTASGGKHSCGPYIRCSALNVVFSSLRNVTALSRLSRVPRQHLTSFNALYRLHHLGGRLWLFPPQPYKYIQRLVLFIGRLSYSLFVR